METIYTKVIDGVRHGLSFTVDFKTKTLIFDGEIIIKNGEYKGELGVKPITTCTGKDADEAMFTYLEALYQDYKHSIPTGLEGCSETKRYFHALSSERLTDDDIRRGIPRRQARAILELTLLCYAIVGQFQWRDEWGTYFWQSKKDRDFVILKDWFNFD